MVDARLPDGSRVNAIIPPLAVDGPLLSIRRFPAERLKAEDLVHDPLADAPDARVPRALRQGAAEHADQRRHRRRQDDAAQRAVGLHPGARAHRHDRRRRRTAAAPGARGAARNAPAEHRRQGRHPAAPAGHQRAAYAPRPHHPRRGPRRRSARHAAGDEHRPRRIADHRPRQHAARRADAYRNDDRDGRDEPAGARDAPADRRRRSRSSSSSRA